MGKLIDTYVAASELLWKQQARRGNTPNQTVVLFHLLTPYEISTLENGEPLSIESIARLAKGSRMPIDECNNRIELFLYWREKTLRVLGGQQPLAE